MISKAEIEGIVNAHQGQPIAQAVREILVEFGNRIAEEVNALSAKVTKPESLPVAERQRPRPPASVQLQCYCGAPRIPGTECTTCGSR